MANSPLSRGWGEFGMFGDMEQKAPTIRDLYPDLTESELTIAGDNLEQYLLLMLRIFERIQSDPKSYAQFRALTEQIRAVSFKPSNPPPAANPTDPS